MSSQGISSDHVIAKLIEMGFGNSTVIEAVQAVGPSFDDAVEYILNSCNRNSGRVTRSSKCSLSNVKVLGKRALSSSSPSGKSRQSSILEHFQSPGRPKRSRTDAVANASSVSRCEVFPTNVEPLPCESSYNRNLLEPVTVYCPQELDVGSNWEQKVNSLLQKHFGYFSLKNFQREALSAWLDHQDCLVLSATGSGTILICCYFIGCVSTLHDKLPFGREIFVFSDSSITDREGCGCDFTLNKLDA